MGPAALIKHSGRTGCFFFVDFVARVCRLYVTYGPFELLDKVVDITPIEEVAATGWGDEFSDDEVTPGKVTILEESDWDDDERSGGEILVIQERLAQNQQEFLDKYLPQWDENLAIQKKESESKWENPFAAKSGENHNHTILHLSKEENDENDDDDLPYPKFLGRQPTNYCNHGSRPLCRNATSLYIP
ncbi:hypothetical protein Tco_0064992 [Tanacetum coccineum]